MMEYAWCPLLIASPTGEALSPLPPPPVLLRSRRPMPVPDLQGLQRSSQQILGVKQSPISKCPEALASWHKDPAVAHGPYLSPNLNKQHTKIYKKGSSNALRATSHAWNPSNYEVPEAHTCLLQSEAGCSQPPLWTPATLARCFRSGTHVHR